MYFNKVSYGGGVINETSGNCPFRTGDQGNISVISVIAYKKEDFLLLKKRSLRRVANYSEIVHLQLANRLHIYALNFVSGGRPAAGRHPLPLR